MAWNVVESYDEVVESIRAFNEGLESHLELAELLSYFRHWYYSPELDMVGPSKFAGYKKMTAKSYLEWHRALDGRDTEAILIKWFDEAEPETPEAARVNKRIWELALAHRKTPNRSAKLRKPRGWTLSSANMVAERATPTYAQSVPLQRTVKSYVRKVDGYYVAECADIAVVTQGANLDEVLENLQEAVSLHLLGEDLAELGLAADPSILVTKKIEPAHA